MRPMTRNQSQLSKREKATRALNVVLLNATPEISGKILGTCNIKEEQSAEINKWINLGFQTSKFYGTISSLPELVEVDDFVLYKILPYNPEIVYRLPEHQITSRLAKETIRLMTEGCPGNAGFPADGGTLNQAILYFLEKSVLSRATVEEVCEQEGLDIDRYFD